MRILINSGDYKCSNMGDLAMLQIAVMRLNRLFPSAIIEILTANPHAVESQIAPAKALPCEGLQQWFSERFLLGSVHQALPGWASNAIRAAKGGLRIRYPGILALMIKAKIYGSGSTESKALEFRRSMLEADLVVVCGQGSLNDVFPKSAMVVLNFVEMATMSRKPTVLFGQGVGPIADSGLMKKAASVLKRADMIALREGNAGPLVLGAMNVRASAIVTTGDDAIELAYAVRPRSTGNAIGVNIRIADHTAIRSEMVDLLQPLFKRLAAKNCASLLPVPISRYPDCKDARDIEQLLSGIKGFEDNGRELDTPLKVIRQVGRCRVVITAAYHAAVFALSQGIPVVGLAKSQYCLDKFLGLDHQFGIGVAIVKLDSQTLEDDLVSAFERAWESAEELRPALLQASRKQIKAGNAAYACAAKLLADRNRTNPAK